MSKSKKEIVIIPEFFTRIVLTDRDISAIKCDINQLRETLDMIEWCINGESENVNLWVVDVIPKSNEVIKHFR